MREDKYDVEFDDNYMYDAESSAMSDESLDNIDLDYIEERIEDQLNNLLSDGYKKNYLKAFERQIENLPESTKKEYRETLYERIINKIGDRFSINIDLDDVGLKGMAKTFYKFFVLHYIDNLSYFVEMYIIDNTDEIIDSLNHNDNINNKRIDGLDLKTSMILNNISEIFDIITNSEITFDEFIEYINKHPDATSIEIDKYIDNMDDTSEVFTSLIAPITSEEDGFGDVYTNIQSYIYEHFVNEEE